MTKILLTRHGHIEGIKPERFRGPLQMTLDGPQRFVGQHGDAARTFICRHVNGVYGVCVWPA